MGSGNVDWKHFFEAHGITSAVKVELFRFKSVSDSEAEGFVSLTKQPAILLQFSLPKADYWQASAQALESTVESLLDGFGITENKRKLKVTSDRSDYTHVVSYGISAQHARTLLDAWGIDSAHLPRLTTTYGQALEKRLGNAR